MLRNPSMRSAQSLVSVPPAPAPAPAARAAVALWYGIAATSDADAANEMASMTVAGETPAAATTAVPITGPPRLSSPLVTSVQELKRGRSASPTISTR